MPIRPLVSTPSAHHYPLLIKQLLISSLAHSPDQEIVYADISRYTYRTLRERIGRLANGLTELGVDSGQVVAVMDWDSTRYLESYFAIPMMGAIMQTVNVKLSPEQILYTLNHAQADILLVNAEFLPLLASFAEKLETVRAFVLMNDEPSLPTSPVSFATEYEALLAQVSPNFFFPDFDENACATLFYSTGTTGNPKGVSFSHRQLVLHALGSATALGCAPAQGSLRRDDVYMPLTPMFHVHAWGLPYLATLLGIKQVYPGAYHPDRLCRLIQAEGVTFSHCVPTVLHLIINHAQSRHIDLSKLKMVIGGSALPDALALAALKRGIDIFGGYGLSETCPILSITHLHPEDLLASQEEQATLRSKAGIPLPLVELRVVDDNMVDLPRDGKSVGEVVVRAPWLTPSYLHEPEASETLWQGGYLHTGDIGHIDSGGYLKITDRAKDVIKTAGEWTSSLELESVLLKHAAVSEVAVVAGIDDKWGERPVALVHLKPDQTISESTLKKHVAQYADHGGLSRFALLVDIIFVESLLKTSVGKINKLAMRTEVNALRARGEHPRLLKFSDS